MTRRGESQYMEATPPTGIVSTRATTTIGTWNVRTMFEAGRTSQVASEMRRNHLSILGISETRWTGAGQKKLSTGELLLWSGHEDETAHHTQGVAIMLSKKVQAALIGWEAHGPRLITATVKTSNRRTNLNIIQCYAPTNDGAEEEKDEFYSRLQALINNCSEKDLLVVMGDLNAKTGSNNTGYEEIMGKQGLGDLNENGERFADLCAANKLVIGGSVFHHKKIHKATWVSPDQKTENQIDHICISKKFRRTLKDTRVRRGADVGSDHHLLIAQLKLKLKKHLTRQPNPRKKYNVTSLKDTNVKTEFNLILTNKFAVLQGIDNEDNCVNTHWTSVKETFTSACEEALGKHNFAHNEWISAESREKIGERKQRKAKVNNSRTRAEKAAAQEKYNESNKIVKKSIKADKNRYTDNLALEAEEAAYKGNMKELYAITRKLSGKYGKPERPVKDKEGNPIV